MRPEPPPFPNPPSDSDWLDWFEPFCLDQLQGVERTRFEAWLAEAPRRKQVVEQFREILTRRTAVSLSVAERTALFDAIISAASNGATPPAQKTLGVARALHRSGTSGFGAFRPWALRIAATVMVLIAVVFATKWRNGSVRDTQTVSYATSYGERSNVTLPDGSRVTLAPSSQLQYSTDASGARNLTLKGRAYFTIAHDPRVPLTVYTGAVRTQVLGTTFDIQHYDDDSSMRIVVVDGKVAVRGRGAPVLLTAGSEATVTDSTANVVTNRSMQEADAWTRGRLVFEDIPVGDLLHALHRWYGYEFRLADSTMARQHVTVMFSVDDTTNVMNGLKALLGVTLQFDGNIVTLRAARRSFKPSRAPRSWPNEIPSYTEVGK